MVGLCEDDEVEIDEKTENTMAMQLRDGPMTSKRRKSMMMNEEWKTSECGMLFDVKAPLDSGYALGWVLDCSKMDESRMTVMVVVHGW
ncbi:unnamed protein product [Anisakis simplex]|uniref:DOMON domain-containing protein n=1 Tax=Anisakis simplex TaxID=6269 RepID=A0A0M3KHE5_ANISI|nr:unnamed protein product [Anisakis simplex]